MMFFITSFFSISPLHVRWLLPYIIKNNRVKDFKAAQPMRGKSWTNVMEKLSKLIIYAVHLELIAEAATRSVLWKKVFQKFHKIDRKRPVPVMQACNSIKKETLAQVLSCEFCEISKNTFFTEHLSTTAFDLASKMLVLQGIRHKRGSKSSSRRFARFLSLKWKLLKSKLYLNFHIYKSSLF